MIKTVCVHRRTEQTEAELSTIYCTELPLKKLSIFGETAFCRRIIYTMWIIVAVLLGGLGSATGDVSVSPSSDFSSICVPLCKTVSHADTTYVRSWFTLWQWVN